MSNLLPILLIVAAAVALMWVLSALDVWQRKGSAVPLRHQIAAWWYRLMHDPEPYDDGFAGAPELKRFDQHAADDYSPLVIELQDAYARYRAGEDVCNGAPKEWV